jgi:hypothetical protein
MRANVPPVCDYVSHRIIPVTQIGRYLIYTL